jgi:hypothetical protein
MLRSSLNRRLLVLVISLLGVSPTYGAAIYINSQTNYGDAVFDFAPGGVASFEHFVDVEATTPLGLLPVSFGFFGTSGPLESWSLNGDDLEFSYGAGGHLFFELDFTLPGGDSHRMVFDGPLGPISGSASGIYGQIDQSPLIPVRLDAASAKLFGMKRHATFELTWLLVDDMFDPGEPWRPGRTFGDFTLYADDRGSGHGSQDVSVPEPVLLTLLPLGLALAVRRGRLQRRRR